VRCIILKAFNADDSIRWLNKLLQETSREPDSNNVDADDIYDEVYNWAVYQSNGWLGLCYLTQYINVQGTYLMSLILESMMEYT